MIFLPAISWADSIRIGAILSLSGNSSANGQSVRAHIESAAERELGSRQFPTLRVNRVT
jgi:hypothetical protein